jgi:hypothetical protein
MQECLRPTLSRVPTPRNPTPVLVVRQLQASALLGILIKFGATCPVIALFRTYTKVMSVCYPVGSLPVGMLFFEDEPTQRLISGKTFLRGSFSVSTFLVLSGGVKVKKLGPKSEFRVISFAVTATLV